MVSELLISDERNDNNNNNNYHIYSIFTSEALYLFFFFFFSFIYDSHTEREREAETQAEGEAGSMHREPDVGFDDPGSPGSRPGPKAGAKPLRHPGTPKHYIFTYVVFHFLFKGPMNYYFKWTLRLRV